MEVSDNQELSKWQMMAPRAVLDVAGEFDVHISNKTQ
jgi:hypothetical protein